MKYDVAVIGGGPGGYTAAEAAAQNGLTVILFEADKLGGTCLNRGCIPMKSLLYASGLYKSAAAGKPFGINADSVSVDFEAMHVRKNETTAMLRQGIEKRLKAAKVTVVNSFARVIFCGDEQIDIEAGGESYTASNLIVAAGSVPSIPPIEGIKLDGVYTSNDLLEGGGKNLRSLIIIGGGVIGCEVASMYSNLGSEVVIIEALEHILPTMDREIAQRLTMYFKKQGISVNTSARVTGISGTPGTMSVSYTDKAGKEQSFSAEGVLIATGRKANTSGIFAGNGPDTERGAVIGDDSGRTSLKNVFVIGDAKYGNIQLAHVAEAQGRNAAAIIAGNPATIDTSVVPSCIYTSPEIASVGITEEEAKKSGRDVRVKKVLTGSNAKCVIEASEAGYVKLIADAKTERIIGAQLICPRATDLVSEFSLAISLRMTAEQVASVIHPHPTFSEMLAEVCR